MYNIYIYITCCGSPKTPSHRQYNDHYCDANCVGGNCCAEFDINETRSSWGNTVIIPPKRLNAAPAGFQLRRTDKIGQLGAVSKNMGLVCAVQSSQSYLFSATGSWGETVLANISPSPALAGCRVGPITCKQHFTLRVPTQTGLHQAGMVKGKMQTPEPGGWRPALVSPCVAIGLSAQMSQDVKAATLPATNTEVANPLFGIRMYSKTVFARGHCPLP